MPRSPLPLALWASPCCAASLSGGGISCGYWPAAHEAGPLMRSSADGSCLSLMVIDFGSRAMYRPIKIQQLFLGIVRLQGCKCAWESVSEGAVKSFQVPEP